MDSGGRRQNSGNSRKRTYEEYQAPHLRRSRRLEGEEPQGAECEEECKQFEYDDIDDNIIGRNYIRILVLEPVPEKQATRLSARARHKLPLFCVFKKVQLHTAEPFEAVSYTWGTGHANCSIFVKTPRGPRSIPIKKNLDECLRRLRFHGEGKPRVLWIDALCINQDAAHEKSEQVKKMAAIYERATRVCIWVGAHENDSGKVIPFIHRILSLNDLDDLLRDKDRMAKWAAFSTFLQRPYFSRRWVIQEIAVSGSKRVYCGDDWIEWTDLSDAINLFEKHNQMIAKLEKNNRKKKRGQPVDDHLMEIKALSANTLVNVTSSLFRMRRMPKLNSNDSFYIERLATLERLVSTLSQFDCGDSRDIIYAVLALGRDTWMRPPLEPDYCGTAVTKVYEDFVEFVIKSSKSLDIICVPWAMEREEKVDEEKQESRNLRSQKRVPPRESHPIPTWIPSYTRRAFHSREGTGNQRANADCLAISDSGEKIYSASGSTLAENFRLQPSSKEFSEEFSRWRATHRLERESSFRSSLLKQSRRLFVGGVRITVITRLERCATNGEVPFAWLKAAVNERPQAAESKHPKRRTRKFLHVPDDFWRTMVADRNAQGGPPPGVYQRMCANAFEPKASDESEVVVNLAKRINETKSDDLAEFLQRMRAVTFNRRFFITEKGSFGLAESAAKTGDIVCILFGCSVPVLLRRNAGKEDYYTVIGPCYVHGVMNGEIMLKLDEKEKTVYQLG